MYVCVHTKMLWVFKCRYRHVLVCVSRSEDNFCKLVFSFCTAGSGPCQPFRHLHLLRIPWLKN